MAYPLPIPPFKIRKPNPLLHTYGTPNPAKRQPRDCPGNAPRAQSPPPRKKLLGTGGAPRPGRRRPLAAFGVLRLLEQGGHEVLQVRLLRLLAPGQVSEPGTEVRRLLVVALHKWACAWASKKCRKGSVRVNQRVNHDASCLPAFWVRFCSFAGMDLGRKTWIDSEKGRVLQDSARVPQYLAVPQYLTLPQCTWARSSRWPSTSPREDRRNILPTLR